MYKPSIQITVDKKDEMLKVLSASGFDIESIEITYQKREPSTKLKLRFRIFLIKDSCRTLWQNMKMLLKDRRIEPRFGGGGFLDFENFYGFVSNLFTAIIIPGLAFDAIKLVIKKTYHLFKEMRPDYLTIISEVRMPADCRVKVLIPTTLDDQGLDSVLEEASQLFAAIDPVRIFFGCQKITLKYKLNKYNWRGWSMKFD